MSTGRLYGVGTGPGDPELLTLKAARVLGAVPVVAHFAKRGNASNARAALGGLPLRADAVELPLLYPVTTEIDRHDPCYKRKIADFYEASAAEIARHLEAGRDVAVLSEGDPFLYGSYMHLHLRLAPRFATEVIPGITSMSGAWSMAGAPIAQGDDVLAVLPGTLPEEELARRLAGVDAAVILKVGRNLPRIRRAIEAAGCMDRALYVERATRADGGVEPLAARDDRPAPYFSLVLVPGWR
ncbi:precorrin-2 C(20)-methyltransferase [Roseococcus pinisoli]|uniref:Precorrin-2 C(20)-methyltransferase n=1 Tax=Roseococcus pinisoli TaxID=2835040 RepID=A0ABS5QJ36_9PROT|nr:precorrin-2 C(20)-methyltransferase [Roseococcus pinisoli]